MLACSVLNAVPLWIVANRFYNSTVCNPKTHGEGCRSAVRKRDPAMASKVPRQLPRYPGINNPEFQVQHDEGNGAANIEP